MRLPIASFPASATSQPTSAARRRDRAISHLLASARISLKITSRVCLLRSTSTAAMLFVTSGRHPFAAALPMANYIDGSKNRRCVPNKKHLVPTTPSDPPRCLLINTLGFVRSNRRGSPPQIRCNRMQHKNSFFEAKGAPSRQPGTASRLGPCRARRYYPIQ